MEGAVVAPSKGRYGFCFLGSGLLVGDAAGTSVARVLRRSSLVIVASSSIP